MDPLPPPLTFFLLLFSGWINRHQQGSLTTCSRKTVSSGPPWLYPAEAAAPWTHARELLPGSSARSLHNYSVHPSDEVVNSILHNNQVCSFDRPRLSERRLLKIALVCDDVAPSD